MKQLRIAIVLLVTASTLLLGQDKVAVATRVTGQVTLTKPSNQPAPLRRNTVLATGDRIRTGADGITVLMFIDDKTILRIQRNSDLSIGGQRTANAIDKQINMRFGKLKAEVAVQRLGQFLISTPTSVASVKGTDFWATSDPVLGDIFLGISGLIEVRNLISNQVIEVGGGQVGTSTPDGQTEVTTYVLLVGELVSVSSSQLSMEATEIGEGGESFNGQIALVSATTYAGPAPTVGSTATVSGTLNDDGSVQAIQIEIQEEDEVIEEEAKESPPGTAPGDEGSGTGGDTTNELRIQLEDASGELKEVVIIFQ